jgi:hypothetical protein
VYLDQERVFTPEARKKEFLKVGDYSPVDNARQTEPRDINVLGVDGVVVRPSRDLPHRTLRWCNQWSCMLDPFEQLLEERC